MTEDELLEGLTAARDRLLLEDDIDTVMFVVKRGHDVVTMAQSKAGRATVIKVAKIAYERILTEASLS